MAPFNYNWYVLPKWYAYVVHLSGTPMRVLYR